MGLTTTPLSVQFEESSTKLTCTPETAIRGDPEDGFFVGLFVIISVYYGSDKGDQWYRTGDTWGVGGSLFVLFYLWFTLLLRRGRIEDRLSVHSLLSPWAAGFGF